MSSCLPCFGKSSDKSGNTDRPTITLTYSVGKGIPVVGKFDFLVVACDPRTLPIADRTPLENTVNAGLSSFTFRTSLYLVNRPETPQLPPTGGPRQNNPNYAVRFNPGPLAKMDGALYAFRDEVMARDPRYEPSPNNRTWITTYQLDGHPLITRNPDQVSARLDALRDAAVRDPARTQPWLDFKPNDPSRPDTAELVDYFPHFSSAGLQAELPWQIRAAQGAKNTLYVSSFTCFESVLHIYLYEEELMRPDGHVIRQHFPRDKNARIAVIGAGPSGILFAARHLVRRGYKNFKVFEKSDHFGGKTMTHRRRAPADPTREVPCELGTCYLSLAYEPMFHLFKEYDAGEVVALDKDTNAFRSVVDPHIASNEEERENGIEYGAWTLRKNGPFAAIERIEMVLAGIRYLAIHYATMGMTMNDCMPAKPPTETTVVGNLLRLVGLADKRSGAEKGHNHKDDVRARDMYAVLKDEKREKDETALKPRGLFELMDELDDVMDGVDSWIPVEDIKKACRCVFDTPFARFLDENNMGELKSVFVYGYQVQGYGTIEIIPAYYGMIWMTPAVLTGSIKRQFSNDPAAKNRGTVNVVTKGWLTLWEKMVERDLKDKLILSANITSITRVGKT